jgi:hypothetical protein
MVVLSSRLADFSGDELSKILAAYRADSVMSAATWRIEEIEKEIEARAASITLAIDEEFRLIVRTPDNRIGEVFVIPFSAGPKA